MIADHREGKDRLFGHMKLPDSMRTEASVD